MHLTMEVVNTVATAVSAVAAVAGVIGLAFYVAFTKRITEATEASLRAAIRPLLLVKAQSIVHSHEFHERRATIEVQNIGNGPALMVSFYEGSSQKIDEFIPEPRTEDVDWINFLPKGERAVVKNIKIPTALESALIVFNCKDQAGNEYQTHAWYSRGDDRDKTGFIHLGFAERPLYKKRSRLKKR